MKMILKKQLWFTNITTLCFIVVALFVPTSCDKEKLEAYVITKVEAKIENASKYSNVVAVILIAYDRVNERHVELARSDFKNGRFTIELPKMLAPNYLHTLINNDEVHMSINNPQSTMTISNKNVNVWHAYFWGVDKDDKRVVYFYPVEIDMNGCKQDVFFTYVDSAVIISGHMERKESIFIITQHDEIRNMGTFPHPIQWHKITSTYSLKWEEGWNVWRLSRLGQEGKTATESWSGTPVSRLKWYGETWRLLGS
jgi:hypothetical protein